MPKLLNGIKGDSNPGSLDCESGILPTELPRSTSINYRFIFVCVCAFVSVNTFSRLIVHFSSECLMKQSLIHARDTMPIECHDNIIHCKHRLYTIGTNELQYITVSFILIYVFYIFITIYRYTLISSKLE